MKISKLLPIALALMIGTSGVFAAATNTDKANYDLSLPEFFNVKATAPAASNVSFDDNYTVATITTPLSGSFKVISNTNTKDIYIYGTCPVSDGNDVPALYGSGVNALRLIFTNTGASDADGLNPTGTMALTDTITAIRKVGGSAAKDSPNAVAFNLTITPAPVANSYPGANPEDAIISSEISGTKNVKYTITNSEIDFGCKVSGTSQDTSFSTLDTNGLYRATLYLSTSAQL